MDRTDNNVLGADKVAQTSALEREDHDSPWKEALEVFFKPFMDLLYPQISTLIDWQQAPKFMDKELQKITRNAENNRRYADKLVQVQFLSGVEQWIYIHTEVQGEPETKFAERMFEYFYRIRDRYQQPVISLAVLTDTHNSFRPHYFRYELAGCAIQFKFSMVKLLDWQSRMDELLHSQNPFGLLIAAQLTAKLVKDSKTRVDNLIGFYRLVIQKDLDKEHIRRLIIFLEWMVYLPEDIRTYYNEQVEHIEEESDMPYISLIERKGIELGIEQGIEQGLEKGISQGRVTALQQTLQKQLKLKFGVLADEYEQRVLQAEESELNLWTERVLFAESVEMVFAQ